MGLEEYQGDAKRMLREDQLFEHSGQMTKYTKRTFIIAVCTLIVAAATLIATLVFGLSF